MRNVIFVAPFPMDTTIRFARALRGLNDVRLLGVFQEPPGAQDRFFDDVAVIPDALSAAHIAGGVEKLAARHGKPWRILGVLEDIQVQLAQVREHYGVHGLGAAAADRFRDKARMKDELRAAGLPCARHRVCHATQDAFEFIAAVGYPIVLKPLAGAGCRSTWRIEDESSLRSALSQASPRPDNPVLAEEFIRGDEFSFETLTLSGRPLFHSISRYYPAPLEVMRNPWMQWVCLLPRDISGPEFDVARKVGAHAVTALGMGSGITHMEWFRRADGSIAIGEIAARPPGAQIVRLMSLAYDTDLYRAWARAVVDEAYDGPWERKYSAGVAFLRGPGHGRVCAIDGLDEAQHKVGALVVDAKLPTVGAPKRDSYEGDGYAIVRHPDTEVVASALKTIVETVKVRYA